MQTERVGIRQFRENLSGYLESSEPVAITRHGQTIGFYVPAKRDITEADREAFRAANAQMRTLLKEAGVTEDDIVNDFKRLRKKNRSGQQRARS